MERIGKYIDPENMSIDVLVVKLIKPSSLWNARTMQRNFISRYLNGSRGGKLKDAALVAFYAEGCDEWRFSFIRMEYAFDEEKKKITQDFTPARRSSYAVGPNEKSHTAQVQLLPILEEEAVNPSFQQMEKVFSVERVTKRFFEQYRELFFWLMESLDKLMSTHEKIQKDFKEKGVDPADFGKKLLGQIVFLYYLQKKGWFGVQRGEKWGSGSKNFLRELFERKHGDYKNFFNDILEPLFYEALRLEHPKDYYDKFHCRIPFLNGGLFDPLHDYDWQDTDIMLPNDIFSNTYKTDEGDIGNGILDIFDRYNFTVKEDEPLEKEVAVDPEMLGKVFENLLEVKDRKSKGTYYTPREIVHYMCQESLINYLDTEINPHIVTYQDIDSEQKNMFGNRVRTGQLKLEEEEKNLEGQMFVPREDIEILIKYGETAIEHDNRVVHEGHETETYAYKLPPSVRKNAKLIDEKLASIRVCDPAVGSGAFPVGMMNEIIRTRNALTPHIRGNGERSPYNFKRHAIQNCLYGVDIDPGAVEIAKLRLWLSLIVDEEEREAIQPLPNLDYKIVQGNALLSVEKNLFNQELFNQLEELKPLFFNETSASKKQKYKKQIDELINQITSGHKDFDFEVYFSEVFHEKKGFDVVIANPPYLSALEFSKLYGLEERKTLGKLFQSAKGTYDLYILFVERAITLLNLHGKLAFINPNKYLSAKYAESLREFILQSAKLDCLVDVSGIRIFDEASVYPVLSFMSRYDGSPYHVKLVLPRIRRAECFKLNNYVVHNLPSEALSSLPENIWGFLLSDKIELLLKLIEGTKPLSQFGDINASTTASESDEFGKWISNTKQQDSLRVLNTGLVDSYACLWGKSVIKVNGKKFLTPYLSLKMVNERRKSMYKRPKVIYAKLAKECEAFLDTSGEYASLNTNIFYNPHKEVSLKYIVAYSNSQLFMFFYNQYFGSLRMGGGFYQFQAPQLRVIPCKPVDQKTSKKIDSVVDKILFVTKDEDYLDNATQQAKVRDYEKQIDQLVYKLYDLTEEEIEIVEHSKK